MHIHLRLIDPQMLFGICRPIVKVYCGHLDFAVVQSVDDFYAKRGGEGMSSWPSDCSRYLDGGFQMVLHLSTRRTFPVPAVPRSSCGKPASSTWLLTADLLMRTSCAVTVSTAFRAEPSPARDLPWRLGGMFLFLEPGSLLGMGHVGSRSIC